MPAASAFHLTWPTVPAIYYGDDRRMRYVPGLPDHEGSFWLGPRYNRAGLAHPDAVGRSTENAGFSTAPAERLYPPRSGPGPAERRRSVADDGSLLHLVRRVWIELRTSRFGVGRAGGHEVLHDGYPLVYATRRNHLVVVNPRRAAAELDARRRRHCGPGAGASRSVAAGSGRDGPRYGIFDLIRGRRSR
ncbi:hypothetical protein [Streptomyces sp. KL116D]|uniref:hypothetical protein n=1 Tax=Streptomyces sp. KL116D TaxID=3045152 RepID=UPI003558BE88